VLLLLPIVGERKSKKNKEQGENGAAFPMTALNEFYEKGCQGKKSAASWTALAEFEHRTGLTLVVVDRRL
jgi:hypothetical protein